MRRFFTAALARAATAQCGRVLASALAPALLSASLFSCALPPPGVMPGGMVEGGHYGASDPLTYEEHLRLAILYEKRGSLVPALNEYKRAALLRPEAAEPHFGIGTVYLKTRQYEKAEQSLRAATELDTSKGVYLNNLAWLYIETGRLVLAQSTAMRGMVLDPQRQYIYLDTLGVIETEFRNYPEAERLLAEAARIIPLTDIQGMLHIYNHLYDLYMRTGNAEKASRTKKTLDRLRMNMPPETLP